MEDPEGPKFLIPGTFIKGSGKIWEDGLGRQPLR